MSKSVTNLQRASQKGSAVLLLVNVFIIGGCILGLFSCCVLGYILASDKQVTASIEHEPIPVPVQVSEDWLFEQAFKITQSQKGFVWSQFTQPSSIFWDTVCNEAGAPKLVSAFVYLYDLNNVNQHALIRMVQFENNQPFMVDGYIMGATQFSRFGPPPPTINMAQIGFKGSQALQLTINNGGNVFHQMYGERCRVRIGIDAEMKWYITYYDVRTPTTSLCFVIDSVLSNPTATISPAAASSQCK